MVRVCFRTRAEEDDGLEVGVLVPIDAQLHHAVAELLQLEDVLHQ